jgi:hypothetical protein
MTVFLTVSIMFSITLSNVSLVLNRIQKSQTPSRGGQMHPNTLDSHGFEGTFFAVVFKELESIIMTFPVIE